MSMCGCVIVCDCALWLIKVFFFAEAECGAGGLAALYDRKRIKQLLISGGILIARIQRQAKNVSAGLQHEKVTDTSESVAAEWSSANCQDDLGCYKSYRGNVSLILWLPELTFIPGHLKTE